MESTKNEDKVQTVITPSQWNEALSCIEISRSEMNNLIMNYLVIEGYKDVAEEFSKDSGTPLHMDTESINDRMQVRRLIENGNIKEAIDIVNEMNPEILEKSKPIYFHLQLQEIIELIRNGEQELALETAQNEIVPTVSSGSEELKELEKVMVLLAFADPKESPVANLLGNSQRTKVANELNQAILSMQCQEKESR